MRYTEPTANSLQKFKLWQTPALAQPLIFSNTLKPHPKFNKKLIMGMLECDFAIFMKSLMHEALLKSSLDIQLQESILIETLRSIMRNEKAAAKKTRKRKRHRKLKLANC